MNRDKDAFLLQREDVRLVDDGFEECTILWAIFSTRKRAEEYIKGFNENLKRKEGTGKWQIMCIPYNVDTYHTKSTRR